MFLLAGGLGTRLRGTEPGPKALAPIQGIPFLLLVLHQLEIQGFHHVHFLLGHGAEAISELLRSSGPVAMLRSRMEWTFHQERTPLGTGGALAAVRANAAPVSLVLNGDSFLDTDFGELVRLASANPERAVAGEAAEGRRVDAGLPDRSAATPAFQAALAAVWLDDRRDYGGLEIDASNRVTRFREKGLESPGWINGGVYALPRPVFDALPEGPSSLERDVLPGLATRGSLVAATCRCYFRDIGTPERLELARQELSDRARRFGGSRGVRRPNE